MTKAEIITNLIKLQSGALKNLESKLVDTHTYSIDRELELPEDEINWGYIASMAIDLDYIQSIKTELDDLIHENI
jgi:hypothetical protein